MTTEGFEITGAGKINANYDNSNIVEKLTELEVMCDERTQLPVLNTIKKFFVAKAELDKYTNIDILLRLNDL